MDYTLEGVFWHTPGHGGGVAFRKAVGQHLLRREHVAVGYLGVGQRRVALDHVGPIAEERNAAFSARMRLLFVVGGTSTANKIIWHGMVGRGDRALRSQLPQVDPAFADHDRRDADLSHSVAQRARHHRADIQGSVHARGDRPKIAASPFAETSLRSG